MFKLIVILNNYSFTFFAGLVVEELEGNRHPQFISELIFATKILLFIVVQFHCQCTPRMKTRILVLMNRFV
jgi:hypothetical protein